MAKQLTEDELNLRRKARRRLIGAITLTLAVVVILPMVLDSEPRPSVTDIELRIPAPDKVGEFSSGEAASNARVVAPMAASAPPAAASGVAQPVVASAVAEPDKSVAGKSMNEVQGKIQPATNEQTEAKTVESKIPDSGESFFVQVGAYANSDTARHEAGRLKKLGFNAYTEKLGDKMRVRVGPYAEREKAEKVRQLLEKHGMHPVVNSTK